MCIRQRHEAVSSALIGDIEEVELQIPALLRRSPSGMRATGYNLRRCAVAFCPYYANPGDIYCGVCRRELDPPREQPIEERINDSIGKGMIVLVIFAAVSLLIRHGLGPWLGWWR